MAESSKVKKTRRRGRPSRNEKEISHQTLIDAARRVLINVDPALVTRQMIAQEAGVDPNLIRYYFGTTHELLTEVISSTHRQARAEMSAKQAVADPVERLRYRIERSFRMFHENPYHHKLVAFTLYGDETSNAHHEWLSILEYSLNDLRDILKSGQEKGVMRFVDPRALHLMIISACEFWASNEPIIDIIFQNGESVEERTTLYVDSIFDIIMRGLEPD